MRSLYWKHILSQRKHKFKLKCPNFWLKRNQDTKNMLNNKHIHEVTAWTHTNAPWYTGMKMSRLHTRNFSNYSTSCICERDKMAAVADFTQDESLVGAGAKLSPPPNPPTRHLFVTQVRIKCPIDWKPACRSHLHFHPDVKRFSLLFTWRLGGRWSQHCTPQHPSGQRQGSTSLWWDGKCSRGKLWGKGWAAGSRWWAEESGNLQSYEECCHLSSLSCYSASQCCLLSAVPLKDRTRHG